MTSEQRQSAIDNTRERIDVLVQLFVGRPDYPIHLQRTAEHIVAGVLALTEAPWRRCIRRILRRMGIGRSTVQPVESVRPLQVSVIDERDFLELLALLPHPRQTHTRLH